MCLQAFRTTRPNDFPIERDHDQSIFPCRKQQQAGSEGGFELLIRVVSGQTWSVGPHWSHSVLTTRGPGTLLCRLPGAAQLREPGGHSQGGGRPSLTAAPGWLDHQRGRLVLQGVHPVQRGRAEVRRAAWGGGWGQPGELQEWRYGRRALFTARLPPFYTGRMRVLNPSSDQISLTDVVVTALCTGLLNSTCFICWSLTDHFNTFPWQAQPIKYCKLCSVQGIIWDHFK